MAESRLYKIGTVFSRIRGLIRGGAIKYEDRPLWYDVYEAFPPRLEPIHDRPAEMKEIQDIMYPEDIIRAQFYKKYSSPGVINLATPSGATVSQKFVDAFVELSKDASIPRQQLFQATVDRLAAQGTPFQERNVRRSPLAFRRREAPPGSPPAEELPKEPRELNPPNASPFNVEKLFKDQNLD